VLLTAAATYAVWHFRLSVLFIAFAAYGLFRAYGARRSGESVLTQILLAGALAIAAALVGSLAWLHWPALSLGGSLLFRDAVVWRLWNAYFVMWVVSLLADPIIWRPNVPRRLRYLLAALLKWPEYLLGRASRIPIMCALAAQSIGLPGLRWLYACIDRWAESRSEYAGEAAAYTYDFLGASLDTDSAAGRWLDQIAPAIGRAGMPAFTAFARVQRALKHERMPTGWLRSVMRAASAEDRLAIPDYFTPHNANLVAWDLAQSGDFVTALPFAEEAVRGLPDDAASIDTLARVKLGLGDPVEAEMHLRRSLPLQEHPGSFVALARALAAQGRHAEAVPYAETATQKFGNEWPSDEPPLEQVRTWIAEWRSAAPPA
jgi:tetratricopeptide (TPR) repeat protein